MNKKNKTKQNPKRLIDLLFSQAPSSFAQTFQNAAWITFLLPPHPPHSPSSLSELQNARASSHSGDGASRPSFTLRAIASFKILFSKDPLLGCLDTCSVLAEFPRACVSGFWEPLGNTGSQELSPEELVAAQASAPFPRQTLSGHTTL